MTGRMEKCFPNLQNFPSIEEGEQQRLEEHGGECFEYKKDRAIADPVWVQPE